MMIQPATTGFFCKFGWRLVWRKHVPRSFKTFEPFDQTHIVPMLFREDKPAPVSQADSSPEKFPADLEAAAFILYLARP